MKWFEGGIPQAIQASKNNKSVFIVFITSEDESSSQMESYLHSSDVTDLCERNRCVAVRLTSDSNDCKFFSQIFPVVVIPSTFFIGDNGTPLEVIGECKSPEDFLTKVQAAISAQNGSSQTTDREENVPKPAETQAVEKSSEAGNSESDSAGLGAVGGVCEGNGDEATPEKKAKTDDDISLEDKVERAKELIRLKQEQKMMKESEDAKSKEQERRKVGQGVQKLRQSQKEMEMLEAKKELKKDREDDKVARQRVKEQIARDRAEKNARFSEAKEERDRKAEEAKKRKLMEQQAAAEVEQARRSEIARIQFRLPDGSSLTQQFPATDTFAAVQDYITGQMGCAISLSTAFPRQNFTNADRNSTLQDLSLAPSAVILVIPGRSSSSRVVSSSSGGGWGLISLLFSPLTFLWSMFASVFGLSSSSSSSSTQPPAPPTTSAQQPTTSATGGDRKPVGGARQRDAASRQQGAIHRFRNAEDDETDEEKATWNGNSTQQM